MFDQAQNDTHIALVFQSTAASDEVCGQGATCAPISGFMVFMENSTTGLIGPIDWSSSVYVLTTAEEYSRAKAAGGAGSLPLLPFDALLKTSIGLSDEVATLVATMTSGEPIIKPNSAMVYVLIAPKVVLGQAATLPGAGTWIQSQLYFTGVGGAGMHRPVVALDAVPTTPLVYDANVLADSYWEDMPAFGEVQASQASANPAAAAARARRLLHGASSAAAAAAAASGITSGRAARSLSQFAATAVYPLGDTCFVTQLTARLSGQSTRLFLKLSSYTGNASCAATQRKLDASQPLYVRILLTEAAAAAITPADLAPAGVAVVYPFSGSGASRGTLTFLAVPTAGNEMVYSFEVAGALAVSDICAQRQVLGQPVESCVLQLLSTAAGSVWYGAITETLLPSVPLPPAPPGGYLPPPPSRTPPAPAGGSGGGGGLSSGETIAVVVVTVIGGLILLALLAFLVYRFYQKKQQKWAPKNTDLEDAAPPGSTPRGVRHSSEAGTVAAGEAAGFSPAASGRDTDTPRSFAGGAAGAAGAGPSSVAKLGTSSVAKSGASGGPATRAELAARAETAARAAASEGGAPVGSAPTPAGAALSRFPGEAGAVASEGGARGSAPAMGSAAAGAGAGAAAAGAAGAGAVSSHAIELEVDSDSASGGGARARFDASAEAQEEGIPAEAEAGSTLPILAGAAATGPGDADSGQERPPTGVQGWMLSGNSWESRVWVPALKRSDLEMSNHSLV
ncbi:hypothetical protein FOA52_004018 [Chlamydomonas sp. UWO 241]|nr:hypothetical protein FOA52_004018 [Chlamydomonas sp. UWO 241]